MIKKLLTGILLSFFAAVAPMHAQTVLMSEDFEAASATVTVLPTAGWSNFTTTAGNSMWGIGASSCIITGSKSMFVCRASAANPCDYAPASATSKIAYKTFSATGYTTLTLDFKWKCVGEFIGSTIYDYGTVCYSTNGTTWTDLPTQYYNQATTQTVTALALPGSLSGLATVYIGFRWVNDISTKNIPGFVIDDIAVKGVSVSSCSGTPSAGTISPASYSKCVGQTVSLTGTGLSSGTGISYQWEISTTGGGVGFSNVTGGTGATTASYTSAALTAGTYYYRLKTTCSVSGLSNYTNEATVVVNTNPTVTVSPTSGTYCSPGGTAVTLTAGGALTYSWSPTTGLSPTSGSPVAASPTTTTTYTVTGTTANGCTGTATSTITAGVQPLLTGPTATPSSICAGATTTLSSSAGTTQSYSVTSISYSPQSDPGGTSIVTGDDEVSGAQTLPFSFSFYGTVYTQIFAYTNGFIKMGSGGAGPTTVYGQSIPAAAAPNAVIGGVWSDLNVTGAGAVHAYTTGVTPNRIYTVHYSAVPFYFSDGNADFYIELYESTGVIEVHVNDVTDIDFYDKTLGIENAGGTLATTPPGRNYTYWDVTGGTHEAWRFTPNGGSVTYAWTESPAGSTITSPTSATTTATGVTGSKTYTVVATTAAGCSATGSVTVNAGLPLNCTGIALSSTKCAGYNFTATSNTTGGGTKHYAWSDGVGGVYPDAATITLNLPAATYTLSVSVTDECGGLCTSSQSVTVNPLPNVMVSPGTSAICNPGGAAVTLTAANATSFSWTPTTGLSSGTGSPVTANPTGSTTYTVTGTDINGCVNTATATVNVSDIPTGTFALATPSVVCSGSATSLTAGGSSCSLVSGFQGGLAPYNWTVGLNNSDGTVDTSGAPAQIIITGSDNGSASAGNTNYSITASCSGTISFNWTYSTIDLDPSYDLFRYRITPGTIGLVPGFNSTGPNTQSGTFSMPITAGETFTLQVRSTDNIGGPGVVTISNFSGPAASTNVAVSWYDAPGGGTLLGTGSPLSITPASTTTYYAQISAIPSGCTPASREPVTVAVADPSTAPATVTSTAGTSLCSGSSTTLGITGGTAGTGTSLVWYSGSCGGTYEGTGATLSVTPSATTTYYARYEDPAPCNLFTPCATLTINVGTPASATISYDSSPYCTGAGTAAVTLSGTTGGTFSGDAGLVINGLSGDIDLGASSAGTHTVTYTIAASGGCPAYTTTATIDINTAPSATISYAGTPFCSDAGPASVSFSGTAGGTYSGDAGLTIDGTNGTITIGSSTAGTHTVTYTLAASGGCATYTTTTTIDINTAPSATISYAGTPFCSGAGPATVSFSGTAGGTYSGDAGLTIDGTTGTITIGTSTTGTHTITYTVAASGGCSTYTTTTTIDINTAPSATISYAGTPFCSDAGPASVSFSGTAGGTYSGDAGLTIDGTNGTITIGSSTAGTHTVTYTLAASGGCATYTTTTTIDINTAPSATISYAGTPFCSDASPATVSFTGTAGGTYSGDAGLTIDGTTGTITIGSSTAGTHTVTYTVAASGGCSTYSTTTTIDINTAPSATISYTGTPFCSGAGPAPVSFSGTSGGTYSGDAGLTIDGTTGTITIGSSTTGTHTVTYTVAASGGCSTYTTTTTIDINTAPSATIAYNGSPYCPTGTASVTLSGTTGGSYSGDAGIVINTASGDVDLSTSTAGTHTVTYTIAAGGGCVASTTTANLTINISGQWTGIASSDWFDPANWCGGVPGTATDVLIPVSAPNQPLISVSPNAFAHTITFSNGTLTINSGSTLSIYGDIVLSPAGTLNSSNGDIYFESTGTQNVPAGILTSVNGLGATSGGNKMLGDDLTVNGYLNLNGGSMLVLGNNVDLTLANTVTGVTASATSYVKTSGTASYLVLEVGATPVTFPVGNTNYNPVTMNNTGTMDNFRIHVRDEVLVSGTTGMQVDNTTTYAINHTFDIEEDVLGGSVANITIQWGAGEENTALFQYNHAYIAHFYDNDGAGPNPAEWHHDDIPYSSMAPAAGGWPGPGPYTATTNNVTTFSPFAIGSNGGSAPLHVQLTDVSAVNEGAKNKVEWHSAVEDGLDHYEVERSTDGQNFSHMADVAATGHAFGYLTYDNSPNPGLTYYRLKLVEQDGSSSYSQIVHAFMKVGNDVVVSVYPNPVSDVLHVEVFGATDDATVTLTDLSGKVVTPVTLHNGQAEINMSSLSSGVYFVKFSGNGLNQSIKVNKQ